MRGWLRSAPWVFLVLAIFPFIGCADEASDDDDQVDDDDADDDVDDDSTDDDLDDDVGPDDDDVDAPTPYRGWMRPCDIDGEPGGEVVVVESAPEDSPSPYRLHVRRTDGTEIGAFDVERRGSSYASIDVELVNLDGDDQCEIVLAQMYQLYTEGTYDSRVRVFDGAAFEVAFDTGLVFERVSYLDTSADVNGGGPDLVLYNIPTWSGASTIEVYDGRDGYRELWRQTGTWDNAFMLLGRRHATGASREACATNQGPAFALVRYPMYQGEPGQWRAHWIDPEGHTLSSVGPFNVDGAEEIDAELMPLTGGDECALLVASREAGETLSRFRLVDPAGTITHDGALDVGGYWRAWADVDADADGEADVLLWTDYVNESKGIWAALSSQGYALQNIVTIDQDETVLPVFWRTSPWLRSGVDLGGGAPNFYIGPFPDGGFTGADIFWRSVGPDLSLTGVDLPVHMSPAIDFGGDALPYWIDDDRPALALNTWSVYFTAAKGPIPVEHGRWAQFKAGQTAPFWASQEPTSTFTIGPIWDFNGDRSAEVLQSGGGLPLTLYNADGMTIMWDGGPREIRLIGEWF